MACSFGHIWRAKFGRWEKGGLASLAGTTGRAGTQTSVHAGGLIVTREFGRLTCQGDCVRVRQVRERTLPCDGGY